MGARRGVVLVLVLAASLVTAVPSSADAPEAAETTRASDAGEAPDTALAADASGAPAGDAAAETVDGALHVVLANVGNVSPACAQAAFKLCLTAVERRVATSLRDLDPDVVALTEVLPPGWCDRVLTVNPFHVCAAEPSTPQVARLLAHDDYDIVCADRFAWDCLAVRASVGRIGGCDGGYCGAVAQTQPRIDGCEDGFESLLADAELEGRPLTIGVAHLNARRADCRAQELTALLDAVPSEGEVLLLGDFNLDPYRMDDASVEVWHAHVGDHHRLDHRSGRTEHDPPFGTVYPRDSSQNDVTGLFPAHRPSPDAEGRTLDHVVATAGIAGACRTLGKAPGTSRIDGPEGGLDHLALDCRLSLPEVQAGAATPSEGTTGPADPPARPTTPPPAGPPDTVTTEPPPDGPEDTPPPGPDDRELLRRLLATLDRLVGGLIG